MKKKLYLDMDGVVADFNAYARKICKQEVTDDRWPEEEWNKIKDNEHLYRDLDKTPEADELVEYCKQFAKKYGYELMFLTAIPRSNDMPWSFYDKVLWIQKYYGNIPVMFGPYSKDKQKHAKPGDILIDDRTSNYNEWIEAGGIAILHKGDLGATIKKLESLVEDDK